MNLDLLNTLILPLIFYLIFGGGGRGRLRVLLACLVNYSTVLNCRAWNFMWCVCVCLSVCMKKRYITCDLLFNFLYTW